MFETNMNTENYISLTSTMVSTIARGHRTMLIEYLLPIADRVLLIVLKTTKLSLQCSHESWNLKISYSYW